MSKDAHCQDLPQCSLWLRLPPQYTSRAAQLYKATLEKDVLRLATAPVSPTAAEAAKQGIDFLDSEVFPLLSR